MLVRTHNGAIEKHFLKVCIFAKLGKEGLPDAFVRPARDAPKRSVPWPEARREVRQGAPVLAIQRTASTNKRLYAPLRRRSPAFPCSIGSIRSYWSSRNSNLGIRLNPKDRM